MLEQQKVFFKDMMDLQENNFKTFLQLLRQQTSESMTS